MVAALCMIFGLAAAEDGEVCNKVIMHHRHGGRKCLKQAIGLAKSHTDINWSALILACRLGRSLCLRSLERLHSQGQWLLQIERPAHARFDGARIDRRCGYGILHGQPHRLEERDLVAVTPPVDGSS